jgi:WD40 repeat protein
MAGAIHWWDVGSGVNVYTRQSHQGWLRSLSVSPDGSMLVSSGEDGVIQLWETERAELLRTLRIDRPYERMEITGLTGIAAAQRSALIALGAMECN